MLLCISFSSCRASAPAQKKYGEWSESVSIQLDNSENVNRDLDTAKHTIEIGLFQKVLSESDTNPAELTYEEQEMAIAKASYDPRKKHGYIDRIHVFDLLKRRGCGSRLFKQTVAHLYQNFPCKRISFVAKPFLERKNTKLALERLERFYTKLGAVIVNRNTLTHDMMYPPHLAAALANLMPLLEPDLLHEFLSNDPVTTIIQYVGPTNGYPADESAAADNTLLNTLNTLKSIAYTFDLPLKSEQDNLSLLEELDLLKHELLNADKTAAAAAPANTLLNTANYGTITPL